MKRRAFLTAFAAGAGALAVGSFHGLRSLARKAAGWASDEEYAGEALYAVAHPDAVEDLRAIAEKSGLQMLVEADKKLHDEMWGKSTVQILRDDPGFRAAEAAEFVDLKRMIREMPR